MLFDETIALNLRAPALLASAVGAGMVAQGTGGSIITVASAAALAPLPEHYAYCASKAGLVMATKVLARELGPLRDSRELGMPDGGADRDGPASVG